MAATAEFLNTARSGENSTSFGNKPRNNESCEILFPSKDLAWTIGFLLSGGEVRPGRRGFKIAVSQPTVRQKLKDKVATVFNAEGTDLTEFVRGKPIIKVRFIEPNIQQTLGDFSKNGWREVIARHEQWLIDNQTFRTAFVNGLFDRRGGADNVPTMRFGASHDDLKTLIANTLKLMGVKAPYLDHNGIRITNTTDILLLSGQISCADPRKEAALALLRKMEPIPPEPTDVELVRQRHTIRANGLPPTLTIMKNLSARDEVNFSAAKYMYRFGEGEFAKTKRFLDTYDELEVTFMKTQPKDYVITDGDIVHLVGLSKMIVQQENLEDPQIVVSTTATLLCQKLQNHLKIVDENLTGYEEFYLHPEDNASIDDAINSITSHLFNIQNAASLLENYLAVDEPEWEDEPEESEETPNPEKAKAEKPKFWRAERPIFILETKILEGWLGKLNLSADNVSNLGIGLENTLNLLGRVRYGHSNISRIVRKMAS
ncbi:hypothetical protein HY024_02330 [Candidatus Curtissbacteria bacterium]|nr:hypothetical protein [Candidatus Curtissbacteria bacterium]